MVSSVKQGDIIELSREEFPALVLSKDFFNESGLAIVCPVVQKAGRDALHVLVETDQTVGIALCEQLKTMDLHKRYYRTIGRISFSSIQEITDIVQSIFDYYP
ncbi:MAG: type II toxin-antitoxin system PemK/MazF family toxin [Eubacterium sp.]|nr:type II toxin-antitoxin system PemK/MazF family toxin [Eubacterium sp.]